MKTSTLILTSAIVLGITSTSFAGRATQECLYACNNSNAGYQCNKVINPGANKDIKNDSYNNSYPLAMTLTFRPNNNMSTYSLAGSSGNSYIYYHDVLCKEIPENSYTHGHNGTCLLKLKSKYVGCDLKWGINNFQNKGLKGISAAKASREEN
jgi:hypothetical protein